MRPIKLDSISSPTNPLTNQVALFSLLSLDRFQFDPFSPPLQSHCPRPAQHWQLRLIPFGAVCFFGILRVRLSNNPFHKGILGIQNTGPQKPTIND